MIMEREEQHYPRAKVTQVMNIGITKQAVVRLFFQGPTDR